MAKVKSEPLVSIIINCFNGEKFLRQCLSSVSKQIYKNWEVIFWDNKSNDNTKKIFNEFKKDKRFKYFFANKHTNLYVARNLAIRKSKGEVLTFLDTDDIWLPNKLQEQIQYFKKNVKAEILYSNYFIKKKILGMNFIKKRYNKILPDGLITNHLLKSYDVAWLTTAFKRKIFKNKQLFNEKFFMVADYDLILHLSLNKNIHCIQKPLAIYRYHSDQLTRNKFKIQISHMISLFNKIKKNTRFNQLNNFKFLKNKISVLEKIQSINKGNLSLQKLLKLFYIFKLKDYIKLIFYYFFPNYFVKYLASL